MWRLTHLGNRTSLLDYGLHSPLSCCPLGENGGGEAEFLIFCIVEQRVDRWAWTLAAIICSFLFGRIMSSTSLLIEGRLAFAACLENGCSSWPPCLPWEFEKCCWVYNLDSLDINYVVVDGFLLSTKEKKNKKRWLLICIFLWFWLHMSIHP